MNKNDNRNKTIREYIIKKSKKSNEYIKNTKY